MKGKIIAGGLLFLFMISFVNALWYSTTSFTNEYADGHGITQTGYKVTYDIKEPGWYLLPYQSSVVTLSQDTADFLSFYKAVDYKYAYSPFTKEYVMCERKPTTNPLYCDIEKIYGKSADSLQLLPGGVFARDYRAYTALSADWHYYSEPVKVVYEYQPFMLFDFEEGGDGDDIGLLGSKLKAGWNLIIYPAYAAYGDLTYGDCNVEELYLWDAEEPGWEEFPNPENEEFLFGELSEVVQTASGAGMAVRVSDDCTFLAREGEGGKDGGVVPPVFP